MARFGSLLLFLILLVCGEPNASADGFRLDIELPTFRERVKLLSAEDLGVGESGYIPTDIQSICRSSDGTVKLLGRAELIEPSEYGHRWNITIQDDNSASLTYQIGTKETDADTDLMWALMLMYYSESCEAFMDRTRGVDGSLCTAQGF